MASAAIRRLRVRILSAQPRSAVSEGRWHVERAEYETTFDARIPYHLHLANNLQRRSAGKVVRDARFKFGSISPRLGLSD
jgi:hypothetical protein